VTRVAVIGGGGAAIRACHAAAVRGARVTLISKGTAAASGCTLAVDSKIEFSVVNWPMPDPDTASTYAADLQAIGCGLKRPERLRLFAERSVDEIGLLERHGVPLKDAGRSRRVQLAGSSYPRGIVCPPRFGARVLQALWAATRRDRVIPNLFAAGDVADSVQGADRINGSGIMEALVFGALGGAGAAEARATTRKAPAMPAAYGRRSPHPSGRLLEWRRRLASVMDEVLVVRDRQRLSRLEPMLSDNLRELEDGGLVGETPATTRLLHELRSTLTTALLVVRASRRREQDLGLFLTTRSR
jgi:succinate dehydrogenase/fumarate reductase flavoprotein subunit